MFPAAGAGGGGSLLHSSDAFTGAGDALLSLGHLSMPLSAVGHWPENTALQAQLSFPLQRPAEGKGKTRVGCVLECGVPISSAEQTETYMDV